MADYLVQEEDGTSRLDLEDSSDSLLLENSGVFARITQEPVEVIVLPDDAEARITQEPVEVIVLPASAAARFTQVPVEVIHRNLLETTRIVIID